MKFNDDILKAWENYEKERANETTPFDRMKTLLKEKYPNIDIKDYSLFWLYKSEAELIFKEEILKRLYRIMNYGYPKTCPIKKFIQSPTLF